MLKGIAALTLGSDNPPFVNISIDSEANAFVVMVRGRRGPGRWDDSPAASITLTRDQWNDLIGQLWAVGAITASKLPSA